MLDKKWIKSGATLVEVLVGMLILAVLVAALYVTYNECQNIISRADRRMIATYWALDWIEQLRQEVTFGDAGGTGFFRPFVATGGDVTAQYPDGSPNPPYNKLILPAGSQGYDGTIEWDLVTAPGMPGQIVIPDPPGPPVIVDRDTGWRHVVVEVNWND